MKDRLSQNDADVKPLMLRGHNIVLIVLLLAATVRAQVSPADHAKHHPADPGAAPMAPAPTGAALAGPAPTAPGPMGAAPMAPAPMGAAAGAMPAGGMPATGAMPSAGGAAPAGGMGGMMDMMKGMGGGAKKDEALYPSLMAMPELTPEKRREIEAEGNQRMTAGAAKLGAGLDMLGPALAASDFKAMQAATAQMRQGVAEFESGVASWRALAEGQPPRDVALGWFRTEMSLAQPAAASGAAGSSWLHWSIMALLIGFAVVMIWMYFHKMKRAAALLKTLTGDKPPAADAKPKPPAADAKPKPPADAKPEAKAPPAAATPPAAPPAAAGPAKRWSGKLRLGQIFDETPNTKTFRFIDPLGGDIPFTFKAGQFLTVTVPHDGKLVKRSYTIASSPTERGYVELTIKREDKGVESRHFHDRLQTNDLLDCSGPFGAFVFTGTECKCLVFIAAGVGITPLMSVTRYLTDRSWPGDIFLLYSCKTPADFVFEEELKYRQRRHPNLHVVTTVSRPEGTDWKGPTGRITKELIAQSVPDITTRRVHICGPKPMMDATAGFLAELGVPKEQVKTEAFGPAIGQAESNAKPEAQSAGIDDKLKDDATPAVEKATDPPPDAAVAGTIVTFSKSGKTAPLSPDKTVLEAAEEIGVDIPAECRVGTCGTCKVKKISGEVTMEVEEALAPGEKESGMILACQAKATANVEVEA